MAFMSKRSLLVKLCSILCKLHAICVSFSVMTSAVAAETNTTNKASHSQNMSGQRQGNALLSGLPKLTKMAPWTSGEFFDRSYEYHLYPLGKGEDQVYRLCQESLETAEHILCLGPFRSNVYTIAVSRL